MSFLLKWMSNVAGVAVTVIITDELKCVKPFRYLDLGYCLDVEVRGCAGDDWMRGGVGCADDSAGCGQGTRRETHLGRTGATLR